MKTQDWLIVVLIIVTFLGITHFFDQPNITCVRQQNSFGESTCPKYIKDSFEVEFSNEGRDNAVLCVSTNSPDINFTKVSDCLTIPVGDTTKLNFKINATSIPKKEFANISITYNWSYNTFFFITNKGKYTCNYKRTPYSSDYKLRLKV